MTNLTDADLELLRDTAARFFDERLPVEAFRKLRDAADDTGFDRARWREMAEMGWAGILVEESRGGVGLGYTALGHILEQSGRTLAATPLVSTALTCAPLLAAGDPDGRHADLLAQLAAGDLVLALALDETPRHAPEQVATRAESMQDGYVLTGRKRFVPDGHVADHLLVMARTEGDERGRAGLTLFLVDPGQPGVRRTRTRMVDARDMADVELDAVEVGPGALIGEPGKAFDILEPVLDGARAGLAAEMLGTGQEAFDRTLEYLKVREQFGAPIGSFQALKHRAAEMFCEIELARSAAYGALAALDDGSDEAAALASVAKAKACDMLELVTNEAVQMHGGIGMTDAADIGLFLKRARVAQQAFGDAQFHRDRYAALAGL